MKAKTAWKRSSLSEGANNCVELRADGAVRDSKYPSTQLRANLHSLLTAVKHGNLDRRP